MASKAFCNTVATLALCERVGTGLVGSVSTHTPEAQRFRDRCRVMAAVARAAALPYRAQQANQIQSNKAARRIKASVADMQQKCRASGPTPAYWINFVRQRVDELAARISHPARKAAMDALLDAVNRMVYTYPGLDCFSGIEKAADDASPDKRRVDAEF